MRTAMHANSLATYRSFGPAELQDKEAAVLAVFGPSTRLSRQQIVEVARIPINSVTGRVKTLLDKGYLVEEGDRIDPITRKRQAILRLPAGQRELPF